MPADETRRDPRKAWELAELAALADGSLPPERREALEQRVAASPRLQALLSQQREALEAVRALEDRAPQHVRESIAGARRPRRPRLSPRLVAGTTVVAAAGLLLALLVVPGSEPSAPTLFETAALAGRPPSPGELSPEKAWGLDFPDLEHWGGWKDAGARTDQLGSRTAKTVYYVQDGRRIAYTIVSDGSVRVPDGTRSWRRNGRPWYAFEQAGRTVVAWERKGHMCVVSASGLRRRPLVELITR